MGPPSTTINLAISLVYRSNDYLFQQSTKGPQHNPIGLKGGCQERTTEHPQSVFSVGRFPSLHSHIQYVIIVGKVLLF